MCLRIEENTFVYNIFRALKCIRRSEAIFRRKVTVHLVKNCQRILMMYSLKGGLDNLHFPGFLYQHNAEFLFL